MSFGELAVCEGGIDGADVLSYNGLDYWLLIDGAVEGHTLMDSIEIEESEDGLNRCRAKIVDPLTNVIEGKQIHVVWQSEIIFAGIIQTLTIDADQAEAAFFYSIEANGWDVILARHTITKTYNNQQTGVILRDAITFTGCDLDGVTAGQIDNGASILLADADHVRVGDFMRDIGTAGGGMAYVDVNKQVQFRPLTVPVSPIPVNNTRAEAISHMSDLDNYRNRQVVRVTGANGSTIVTETRNNLAEQTARIADEGGSGIYENYVSITHPTSSVSGELSILGQTFAFVQLRTYARNARRVTVTMRDPAPRFGELVNVDLPGFNLLGQFIVMRKTWREVGQQWLFDLELWESSFQQRAIESLLKIAGVGKATISLADNVFTNVQLYNVPGEYTFIVPAGVTSLQFTCVGGSGAGGGGARWTIQSNLHVHFTGDTIIGGDPTTKVGGVVPKSGGAGGTSGKAVTILAVVVPFDSYSITVGAAGIAGINNSQPFIEAGHPLGTFSTTATAGTSGGNSLVRDPAAAIICLGNASTCGTAGRVTLNLTSALTGSFSSIAGVNGTNGSGLGDAIVPGGGQSGGIKGTGNPYVSAGAGKPGYVEVRW